MGKLVELHFGEIDREEAEHLTIAACKKLLANPVIEDYTFELITNNAQGKPK
jgi:phosphoribosylformylglycinamidine (FGAM) synthase PurS component